MRDPDGGWDSAGMYAVRAGLLCDLEPGYATLVGRVLGPLLEAGRLVGLPVRGPVADEYGMDRRRSSRTARLLQHASAGCTAFPHLDQPAVIMQLVSPSNQLHDHDIEREDR